MEIFPLDLRPENVKQSAYLLMKSQCDNLFYLLQVFNGKKAINMYINRTFLYDFLFNEGKLHDIKLNLIIESNAPSLYLQCE